MLKNLYPSAGGFRLDSVTPYLKRAGGVLIAIVLVLACVVYALRSNRAPAAVDQPTDQCICPDCGIVIQRPANLDCEEVNCPNCGQKMDTAATLAAATGGPGFGQLQAVLPSQQDTFAGQALAAFPPAQGPAIAQEWPQPGAAETAPPPSGPGTCVCPNCGWKLARQAGFYCSRVTCPNCQAPMTNSIPIGAVRSQPSADAPAAVGTRVMSAEPAPVVQSPAANPEPRLYGNSMPTLTPPSGGLLAQGGSFLQVAAPAASYSTTVQPIIAKNCLRCHGGLIRNLSGYSQVKSYADSGMMMMMIQPGGPMSRFLTAEESEQISSWIKAGAPQ